MQIALDALLDKDAQEFLLGNLPSPDRVAGLAAQSLLSLFQYLLHPALHARVVQNDIAQCRLDACLSRCFLARLPVLPRKFLVLRAVHLRLFGGFLEQLDKVPVLAQGFISLLDTIQIRGHFLCGLAGRELSIAFQNRVECA